MRVLRIIFFVLISAFCLTLPIQRTAPSVLLVVKSSTPDSFKEVTRRCVISGRFVGFDNDFIYVKSPKEGLVRVKVSLKTRILFHNCTTNERLEASSVKEAVSKFPDAVTIGVNEMAEDVIFAVTKD